MYHMLCHAFFKFYEPRDKGLESTFIISLYCEEGEYTVEIKCLI